MEYLDSLELPRELLPKWQSLTNVLASATHVTAAFVVRYCVTGYEVLLASSNKENPYTAGKIISPDVSTFCQEVVETCEMLVEYAATHSSKWATNAAVQSGRFNTYIGFPILNPDDSVFGALCVMDYQSHPLSETEFNLMKELRSAIEMDLRFLHRFSIMSDLSLKDDLTGLYNRRGFNVLVPKQYQLGRRSHKLFGIAMFDLDFLKQVNDRYGHAEGDLAIVKMAQALSYACRKSDILARIGGDEFVAALVLSHRSEIDSIVKRARSFLAANLLNCGALSFSWGCHAELYSIRSTLDMPSLLKQADTALYRHKSARISNG